MRVSQEHVSTDMSITLAVILLRLLNAILLVNVQVVNAFLEGQNEDLYINKISDTQHAYCLRSSPCTPRTEPRFRKQINFSTDTVWDEQIELKPTDCCKPCSCISFTCRTSGDCCPDIYETFDSLSEAHLSVKTFCEPLQLKPRSFWNDDTKYPNSEQSVVMYKKCPSSTIDLDPAMPRRRRDDLRQMCENENSLDIISKLPVTSRLTRQTYKNIYCAECYGIKEEVDFWDPQIVCNGSIFETIYTDKVVNKVLETENCNIIFSSEYWLPNVDKCNYRVSECNVSGKWKSWDPVIEQACSAYTAPYMELYGNIFCYMCSGDKMSGQFCNVYSTPKTDFTFSLVLDFKNKLLQDNTLSDIFEDDRNCHGHTVYDILQKLCIEASCILPKIYIDGSCVNFANKIGGVGYRVFLQVLPLLESMVDDMDKQKEYFLNWLNVNGLEKWIYTFSMHFMSKGNITTSTKKAVAYSVIYFEFYISERFPENVSLIDNLLEMHDTVVDIDISPTSGEQKPFYVRLDLFDVHTANLTEIYLSQLHTNGNLTLRLEKYFVKEYQDIYIPGLKRFNKNDLRPLLPIHKCPMVTINSSFYGINHFPWGVSIERSDTKLNRSEYEVKQGDRNTTDIRICKNTFDVITEQILAVHASSTRRYLSIYLFFLVLFITFCSYI